MAITLRIPAPNVLSAIEIYQQLTELIRVESHGVGAHHMRRKAAIASLIFVGLVASVVGWGFYRNSRISNRFERVTVGTSDEQVRNILGQPSWIEPCGKSFGTPKANCTEYIYRNSFAPLVPEYFSVTLDTSGHVLDKYVYESP